MVTCHGCPHVKRTCRQGRPGLSRYARRLGPSWSDLHHAELAVVAELCGRRPPGSCRLLRLRDRRFLEAVPHRLRLCCGLCISDGCLDVAATSQSGLLPAPRRKTRDLVCLADPGPMEFSGLAMGSPAWYRNEYGRGGSTAPACARLAAQPTICGTPRTPSMHKAQSCKRGRAD